MECLELEFSHQFSTHQTYDDDPFNLQLEESIAVEFLTVPDASRPSQCGSSSVPEPPPPPKAPNGRCNNTSNRIAGYSYVPDETRHAWDRLFREGYEADVHINADDNNTIVAHSSVLGITSPVIRNMLAQEKVKGVRYIKIHGVPSEAIRAFLQFLYSSCYQIDDMKKYVLHLLLMSHSYSVPYLKKACIELLEQGLLNTDNVVDVLQLSRQCDAPRLTLLCTRMILKDFKMVSLSEGWKIMKQTNPGLEQELIELLVESDSKKQEMRRKIEEKKVYLQLHEAMEALVHICRDGCSTIGPRDKALKGSQTPCKFPACKGLESLVRHFSGCKIRVPGGCTHCKRMWQLFELHSRMCSESEHCKVPLCRHFKDKIPHQCRKEETKWKLLVSKVLAARGTISSISALRPLVP